ncbi:hypothetical protein ACA910_000588 [Epithemia clementina (nom. ined.)]
MATGGMALSKEFFEFLKAIGESKSKQEEDRIVLREIQRLKSKLEPVPANATHPLSSKKKAKEFLVRILYVEMLGHDASFGYIKAVELAASASLYHKRTGYLVCGACLPPAHEFRFMLVNQMQRDLNSSNVLECSGGVLACTSIITADMVPAVASEVKKLLHHESATIRKKSIVCYHRFHQLDDQTVTAEHLHEALRKSICDKEPSVMGASLSVIEVMLRNAMRVNADQTPFKELVPSLVSILKQIGEHRLPSDYEYHRVPAPWMQLKLIRILGLLGQADHRTSQGMYEVLSHTLKQADSGINAGYAIIYECCFTIVKIYPNPGLLDAAAEAISRFMTSRSNNVKYLGVTALAQMVEQHPKYAAQHQLAVLDCLEDSDETLQRKTLDLLYRMTNPVNVEFIAAKLIEFITDTNTTDLFLKQVLTTRVCTIAEKYAPNNAWYISTITHLCQVAGDWVDQRVAQNLMSLLAEGTGESEDADLLLRRSAIDIYVDLLSRNDVATLPSILIETMAWCLGEYAYLSETTTVTNVMEQLCILVRNYKTLNHNGQSTSQRRTRNAIVSAILKLVAQAGTCPPRAAATIDEYTRSTDAELAMQCLEFQAMLTQAPHMLPHVFPVDASAEDLDVDVNLSFLDAYVHEALSSGRAQPYDKPEEDDDDDDDYYGSGAGGGSGTTSAFNLTPYEKPTKPTLSGTMMLSSMGSGMPGGTQGMSLPPGASGASAGSTLPIPSGPDGGGAMSMGGLNTRNVANVWGKGGLNTAAATPTAAAPVSGSSVDAHQQKWNQFASSGRTAPSASVSSLSYGASIAQAPTSAPLPAEKTSAQLEKERMAAALFGGIVPGSTPPAPPSSTVPSFVPKRTPRAPVTAPAPPPVPPPAAAAPAPEIDLLDMSAWDAASPAPAPSNFDVVTSAPTESVAAPSPLVETVSDDDGASKPALAPAELDPFAGAGLLDSVEDQPLSGLTTASTKFEYNGTSMTPLKITTAQFGQQWGSCPGTSNGTVQSSSITGLDSFMSKVQSSVGAHLVEAIAATQEGICAGSIGASHVCLIHAKLTSGIGTMRIDFTVKSTDPGMASSLAMHLQTMLR